MTQIRPFHALSEIKKPARERIYHNDDACPVGQGVRNQDRRLGSGDYRLCRECARLNGEGKAEGAG